MVQLDGYSHVCVTKVLISSSITIVVGAYNTLSYQSSLKTKSCTQDSVLALDAVLSEPKDRALFQSASISSVLRDYTIVRESK